ncbi:hydroxymethylpyrimidine/phosphomethylpyrimidine kinase [Salsuginibacillus halophilus]|uniref:Hydroxymethylpyrimidine/phosphomethylpyrimidine kinase n=1 Tax=Salsuginibacillus halophilus TaxID=517424 RepID=A0A2P8H7X7_9BACI|nr:bifunctional hydroxymethylpyrimidine kinase/phosphomethylpyrimidine kinase [Salsuginibacillus halophilus]PSL42335.1 hydroxymethylpyrimidine/phosphomethylpyrimidine kinase [Salsuginibacillus halophilus]
MTKPIALTIAGSDSGGGAGIQADLKTFQERDVFGTTVITALTAQNTEGVHGVFPESLQAIDAQLEAVLTDLRPDAVKTGMMFSAEIIERVAFYLKKYHVERIVIDPVMIAKGGAPLLQQEAADALKTELLPLAHTITPNLPEAEVISGLSSIQSEDAMKEAASLLHDLGAAHVVVKGGHRETEDARDLFSDGREITVLPSPRIATKHTHGTGCTFAACIAAELAKGETALAAVQTAKAFITSAITHALPLGGGIGPTDHSAYRYNS